jgi:hypothetical protein
MTEQALEDADAAAGGEYGLTPGSGVQEAVSRHCEFGGYGGLSATHELAVQDMLRYLVGVGEADRDALLEFFRPIDAHPDPDAWRYSEWMGDQWWRDVGSQLEEIPGVQPPADDGDTWRFVGVPADALDAEEHTRPLEDLRADPEFRVEIALNERGVGIGKDVGSGVRDELLAAWEHLRAHGEASPDELERRALRRTSIDEIAEDLEALPNVERVEEHPPEPEDLEISTYADVLAAKEAVDRDVTVEWRYSADAEE